VAFAIAAIVSPADPVAVEAISRRVHIPRRMMAILEGEALFHDASGLVAFRFAVAAAGPARSAPAVARACTLSTSNPADRPGKYRKTSAACWGKAKTFML